MEQGGYNLESISLSASNCVAALIGLPLPSLPLLPLEEESQETLKEVVDYQKTSWPSLVFGVDLPENLNS